MKEKKLSNSAKRMIKKYGEAKCTEANNLYDDGIMGASGVAWHMDVHVNTASGLISAGEEIKNL